MAIKKNENKNRTIIKNKSKSKSKNRKYKYLSKPLFIASSIITLNFLGISYAAWNEDVVMNVSMSTGYINPYFSDCRIVDKVPQEEGGLTAVISSDGQSIEIRGTVERGYEGILYYTISDNGSVPTDYCGEYFMEIKPGEGDKYEFTVDLPFSR
ncbi:MAG: hypothetical protein GYA02_14400 [Clostridiaceae bacterium]|nr:hypothetical protein [Clostridiaceae bacterium]